MSVFRGSITEYPGVIVDHFVPFNCQRGRAFFLSHCHKDHMTGLGSAPLLSALQRRNTKLYCSEVTRFLLLKNPEFSELVPFLHALPTDEPVSMALEPFSDCEAMTFTVVLLPAGHCPGSTMFLFQGGRGNVLYSGDFRMTLEETKRLRALHCGDRVVDVATLYVDTTLCTPLAKEIPSREVSRDHILRLIERWLPQSPRNVVHLQCAMFGFEHIFMGVAKKFITKVHIAGWRLEAYSKLPAVAECLTTDGESTRIHSCNFRKGSKRHAGLPCGCWSRNGRPPNVLHIKPSTQWFIFSSKTISEPYVFLPQSNTYRVIHSMHASYSEVCSFVAYLKPRRVVPCVVPFGDSALSDVHSRLKTLLPQSEVVVKELSITENQRDSTTGSDSKRTQRKKREGDGEKRQPCAEEDSDWSSVEEGGETIDDFPSSEEQLHPHEPGKTFFLCSTEQRPPPLPASLDLPAMFTQPSRHLVSSTTSATAAFVPTVALNITPSPPSCASGSESVATYGSLQQTSLDLSLNDSPATGKEGVARTQPKSEEAPQSSAAGIVSAAHSDSGDSERDSDEVWHLTMEGSTGTENEEDTTVVAEKSNTDCTTPKRKRRKPNPSAEERLTPIRSKEQQTSSVKEAGTSRRLFEGEEEEEEERVFIDLTQDDSDVETDSLLVSGSKYTVVSTPVVEPEEHSVTIVLSDSLDSSQSQPPAEQGVSPSSSQDITPRGGSGESDGRVSPLFLPPTPGREDIESILGRKSIAFS